MYILLRSIYQVHNLLFYSGHPSSSFFLFFVTSIPTWKNFELTRWPSLNYSVYLVGLHQLFFNNFRSWLRIGFRDHAVSWTEVFVTKIGGFQLLVPVPVPVACHKGLGLRSCGSLISFAVCSYLLNFVCFEFLVLKLICL